MKRGQNVWIVCAEGRFSIKEERSATPLIRPASQRIAIRIGRLIAQANKSELIIQNKHGRIRAKDSHGFDDYPPKG